MLFNILGLLLSLGIILLSCELFTNGVEWLGKKLKVGDGVVGSLFSAVGTCLPETTIPVAALLMSDGGKSSIDICIGAIAGAPFMLSTLAFFVTGLSVLIFRRRRRAGIAMGVNTRILSRDLGFFILLYSAGIVAAFIPSDSVRHLIAISLIFFYFYYIYLTVKHDRAAGSSPEKLYFRHYLNIRSNKTAIIIQVLAALAGIFFGAQLFIGNIESLSQRLGISALILSLIIAPIATELPEKFNSIIWIRRSRDTLALGNITGALVFQSCFPVAFGILATSWTLDLKVIISGVLALASALLTYLWVEVKEKLSPLPLLLGGGFYAAFIVYIIRA